MAAHLYWRIRGYAINETLMRAAEIQMRGTPGGSNLATGGTPFASSSFSSSYLPSFAFDGSLTGNAWASSSWSVGATWIGYQFASPVAINEIAYASAEGVKAPTIFVVESSDDGTTYTPEWWGVFTGWVSGTLHLFTRPSLSLARYWGLIVTVGNPNRDLVASEIAMREVSGGTNVALGCTGVMTPQDPGYPASQAFDGNSATLIYSGQSNEGSAIYCDFGSGITKLIVEMEFYKDASSGNSVRAANSGAVVRSSDTMSWDIVNTFSGRTYAGASEVLPAATAVPTGMVGTATGTSTAVGVSGDAGSTVGTAAGTSTAIARAMPLGTISTAGTAFGQGVASGIADPFRRAVGSAAATSSALGIGAAVGTISTVGHANATSAADSGSMATGIVGVPGAASATSAASGVGTGVIPAAGAAAGASAAVAGGSYAPTRTVGRSFGTSNALAQDTGVHALAGLAIGKGAVLGFMASVRAMVGAAAGQGSVQGVSNKNDPGVGSSVATSSAPAVGTGIESAVGSASATSAADAGGSYRPTGAVGISTGGSTAIGCGSVLRSAVGLSSATSTTVGVNSGVAQAAGSATGTSTSVGVSLNLQSMAGSAAGTSTGDAPSSARAFSVGAAHGTSLALGIGMAIGPGMELPEIVLVRFDGWLVAVPPPSDEMVIVAVDDAIVVVPLDDSAALAA